MELTDASDTKFRAILLCTWENSAHMARAGTPGNRQRVDRDVVFLSHELDLEFSPALPLLRWRPMP